MSRFVYFCAFEGMNSKIFNARRAMNSKFFVVSSFNITLDEILLDLEHSFMYLL